MLGKVVWIILNVLLVLVGNVLLLVPEDSNSRTISTTFQEECVSYCPDLDLNQNRTNDTSSDVGCGVQCQMDQCTKGCGAWRRALDTSCQAVCNGTREILPPKVLYCVIGCHNALNRYFQQLKAEIGVPPAPALVADSLTATSLRLEWKGTDVEKYGAGISYLVQWRYEALAETWQYCRNQSWGEDDQILVENLQPYTKYRFRVALLLKSAQHNPEAIVSAPSVVILTLADGLPTSAPVIVRAAAVDSCRVSVSWEPGPFTNGPLLSYVLRLQGADHSQLKNIPASENTGHYMFQNLKPNKNYSISVTMRNGVGEGPAAVVHIATTPEPAVKDMQQPILILGGEHVVVQQGADMLDEPSFIYRTTSTIRGVAIHVATANLFVSDSMGYVYRMPIPRMDPIEASTGSSNVQSFDEHSKNHRVTEPTIILSPNEANFKPSSLSVDWLNLHLYVLGEVKHATTVWQIARCNLDGRGLTVATSGFLTKPSHIEVDPYNGYLFWVTRGGLYRLDLADISNGVKHEVQPFLILEDAHLGAFTVDHTNFRLLVPHHTENTVISVSLDGRELIDLRANTQQSKFKNVVSLAAANGLFYWTNGEEVLTEGYHPGQNRYFHNAYPDRFDGSFVSVNVLMNASQPVPVPVNPPTGVQAVLGTEKAKISWQAPHLLGGQGKGAWQNWSYELEIKDESTGEAIHPKNIAGSSHTVRKLSEGSEYSIKAAAYTSAGRGPWSSEFRGRTLRGESHASILWSSSEGLLKSDVTGENIDTLIYKASFKDYDNEYHIVDVSWYRDVLYVVGNNSALYKYNMTSHEKVKLNINSVGSVAVDWISKKLYWANPKQQIITRANLNGSQQEPMAILAIVKELVIDSLEGYLYWSSGHAVEVAHLNGQDRRYYHSDEIFNGKQVMGLTLDTENRFIYWIVRSYESGSIVFRAPTSENISMNQKIIPEKVSALQHPSIQGPLCYFSEHLLWLQDDKNAIIGDLSGQNTAIINGITLSGLYMVAVMDPALHRYPQNLSSDEIVVLPNSVNIETLRIEGTWRNFNISWDPIDNTNYGSVFYEVKFVDYINSNSNSEITTETTVPYNNSEQILPYSVLEVSVKAFTYWETANPTRKRLRSPESIPTQPINPRAYVDFHKDMLSDDKSYNIYVTFRWDTPEFPNGLILGYRIRCWYTTENGMEIHVCRDATVLSSEREYTIEKLTPNTRYYLQVQAYTKIGSGPYSDTINVTTDRENPIPRLVITTTNAVKLADLDYNTNYSITEYIAVDVTYLSADNRIYWINEMHELVTSTLDGLDASKMLSLNNTALCLCVDWVSRTLFWAELDGGTSRIVRFDLIQYDAGILKYRTIVSRNKRIASLIASPLTGSLYWVETTRDDEGIILQSDLFGENIRDFFNKSENCSCPQKQSVVRPSIAVDTNGTNKLYWISAEGSLNTASLDGCTCNTIMSTTFANGLPPTSLAVDKINIYWSNMATNSVYYIRKNDVATSGKDTPRYSTYYLPRVKEIETVGKSLQRYPPPDCLIPYQVTYDVEEESKTANSITVGLPQPVAHAGCENYSLPTTLYTIHVSQCLENNPNNCDDRDQMKLQTYDRRTVVSGLKPFTKYRFKLALSNYYSDLSSLSLEFNSGVILTTGAGAPTTPENVTVKSLTPNSAAVYWMPPKSLNAAAVRYEIHWTSLLVVNGIRQKGEQIVKDTEHISNEKYMTILHPLQPNQAYMVYVRAYPTHFGGVFSESTGDIVRMYPEPNNLTLIGVTINSMNVSWEPTVNLTVAYTLQYQEVGAENWMVAKNTTGNETRADKVVVYNIRNLQPKTMYKFRLLVKYPDYHKDYVWPTDSRFTFQTLGDVPSTPGVPVLMKLRNSVYQLNWEPAQAHGSQINLYRLVGIILNDQNSEQDNEEEVNDDEDQWIVYYNGTDNYWIIMGEMTQRYRFRVQARNDYGFGAWSKISDIVDLTSTSNEMLASQEHLGLVLGLSVPVITIMLLCFCCFLCLYKQRKEEKKAVLAPIVSDVELATLREIPRGNFVQSNTLYASTMQNYTDETALPKIRRDQITLAKFLGSGAFGEVYQGSAVGLGPGATPVAIKTLRKGASAQEKTEFLQEARLMSHFRHKHVLRLLGVCLDTDPPLLVLELMEAGDLLSYLRASRILQPTEPSALKLQDLLAMCEDVARGCRYLEELHFVHRDLACRNCLVSARDRENRVVKIGDFGLARDIYKNDYYRKEGEGLLPVRWMAPESLVDGVFTSQSDVWAFGVLMWEITSLGQQPYPARTNLEVLHHVRAGGRLPKPLNCPPALHQLMLLCWGRADARPSFKTCLDRIVTLRNNIEDSPLSPVHVSSYLARQGNSWKSSSSEGSRDMQSILQSFDSTTTILQSTDVPKYLELLADSENVSSDATSPTQGPIARDNHLSGYEIPKPLNISDKKMDYQREARITPANTPEQTDNNQVQEPKTHRQHNNHPHPHHHHHHHQSNKQCTRKRSSFNSLNTHDRKLDAKNHFQRDSLTSLSDRSKYKPVDKRCLESRNCGSLDSISLTTAAVPAGTSTIRPTSSSLISAPKDLATENDVASITQNVVINNAVSKLNRSHSNLQNGKANIPLVINNALLNLLRQTQNSVVEDNVDNVDIVTYTNINSDTVRVNGS